MGMSQPSSSFGSGLAQQPSVIGAQSGYVQPASASAHHATAYAQPSSHYSGMTTSGLPAGHTRTIGTSGASNFPTSQSYTGAQGQAQRVIPSSVAAGTMTAPSGVAGSQLGSTGLIGAARPVSGVSYERAPTYASAQPYQTGVGT